MAFRTSDSSTDKHRSRWSVIRSVRSLEAGGCFSSSAFKDSSDGTAGLSPDIKSQTAVLTLQSSSLADMA